MKEIDPDGLQIPDEPPNYVESSGSEEHNIKSVFVINLKLRQKQYLSSRSLRPGMSNSYWFVGHMTTNLKWARPEA